MNEEQKQEIFKNELLEMLEVLKNDKQGTYNDVYDYFVNYNWFKETYFVDLYSYMRASTTKQEFGREVIALYNYLKKKNIKLYIDNIYLDKFTGKKLQRNAFNEMKKNVASHDYILVTESSRLGRNYKEMKKEWATFKEQNINILMADTIVGELLNSPLPFEPKEITLEKEFLQDILIPLVFLEDQNKINIVSKTTKDGIKKAKAKGKTVGKPCGKYTTIENFIKVLELQENGLSSKKACEKRHFPESTYFKYLKEYRQKYNIQDNKTMIKLLKGESKLCQN